VSQLPAEFDELRISLQRLRALLEMFIVRGLRACGPEQLVQLKAYTEQFEQAGAGHVASVLAELHDKIDQDDRGSARALLKAQTSVRLLERMLTLRVVEGNFQFAIAQLERENEGDSADADEDGEDDN